MLGKYHERRVQKPILGEHRTGCSILLLLGHSIRGSTRESSASPCKREAGILLPVTLLTSKFCRVVAPAQDHSFGSVRLSQFFRSVPRYSGCISCDYQLCEFRRHFPLVCFVNFFGLRSYFCVCDVRLVLDKIYRHTWDIIVTVPLKKNILQLLN